jgi:hypothetical protein
VAAGSVPAEAGSAGAADQAIAITAAIMAALKRQLVRV